MPTDLCPETGALRGGRAVSLTRRRARQRMHAARAHRARHRYRAAWPRWRWIENEPSERVALAQPFAAGYVREFVPAVRPDHADFDDLQFLLDWGIQRTAHDHIRAFTNPSFPHDRRRGRRKGSVPVHELRSLSDRRWEALPDRLRPLLRPVLRWAWTGTTYVERYTYRFRYPDRYRLQVRQLWVTHEDVPTGAARERASLSDRYSQSGRDIEDFRYLSRSSDSWRRVYCEQTRGAQNRRARFEMEHEAMAHLPAEALRATRIRP